MYLRLVSLGIAQRKIFKLLETLWSADFEILPFSQSLESLLSRKFLGNLLAFRCVSFAPFFGDVGSFFFKRKQLFYIVSLKVY